MNDLARAHGASAVCLTIDNAAKVQPVNGNARPERIEPIPLVRPMPPPEPFPVDAMGVLAPAVLAVQELVQCPKALAANSVLAAVTLAAQPHINVQMPFGSRPLRPVSSFFITVGRSGERKTGADEIVTRGIRKREADLRAAYDAELKKYRVRHDAWEAERRSIMNARVGKGKAVNLASREADLRAIGPEPDPPLQPIIVMSEPTTEGLCKLLLAGQPSVGLFSAEGGQFVGGHAMADDAKLRSAATLSDLWGGDP